jgi:hypothetical protein
MIKTKLVIQKRDRQIIHYSSLPREEAIAQWKAYKDPMNVMPFLRQITGCVVSPLALIGLILSLCADLFSIVGRGLGMVSDGLFDFCLLMTENHTVISDEDD